MKRISISLIAVIIGFSLQAQDLNFRNMNQSLVYMNPSFAGTNKGFRFQSSLRNQTPGQRVNYLSALNTADLYLEKAKGGIFVSHLYDNALNGLLKTHELSLGYAQHLSLLEGKLTISPSVRFCYFSKKLDRNRLSFGDPIDYRYGSGWGANEPLPAYSKSNFDLSSGLLVNYKNKVFAGASLQHVNQPDIGLLGQQTLPMRLNAHASYNATFGEKHLLQIAYYFYHQGKYVGDQLSVNAVLFRNLTVGVSTRRNLNMGFNLGFRTNYFSLSAGYDYNAPPYDKNKRGSYEIHASVNVRDQIRSKDLLVWECW